MKYEIEDIIPELIEVKFVLECSSGIRYIPAAHGRQVNGARKLRFERMTPIQLKFSVSIKYSILFNFRFCTFS